MSEQDSSAKIFGIASIILGAITFGWQLIGGLCCGWLGWPLGVGALICALMTLSGDKTAKTYGIIGAGLSVIGIIIQIAVLSGIAKGLVR